MLQALSELESLPFSWTLISTLKKIFWDKNLPSIKSVSPLSPLLATWLCIPPLSHNTNIECWMWIVRWDVLDKSGCLKSNQEKWRMALEKPSHSKLSYYKAWAVLDIRVLWPQPPWEVHQLSTVWVDQCTRGRVSVEWRNLRRAELSLGSLQRQPGQPSSPWAPWLPAVPQSSARKGNRCCPLSSSLCVSAPQPLNPHQRLQLNKQVRTSNFHHSQHVAGCFVTPQQLLHPLSLAGPAR